MQRRAAGSVYRAAARQQRLLGAAPCRPRPRTQRCSSLAGPGSGKDDLVARRIARKEAVLSSEAKEGVVSSAPGKPAAVAAEGAGAPSGATANSSNAGASPPPPPLPPPTASTTTSTTTTTTTTTSTTTAGATTVSASSVGGGKGPQSAAQLLLLGLGFGVAAAVAYDATQPKEPDSPSILQRCQRLLSSMVEGVIRPFADPSSDKLLPSWPLPNMHPDTPCPPTLVLDLEQTLVATDWNRKQGWRIAKRPGVDKFLEELCQHFEIVIFTSNHFGTADPIITSLDPKGCVMWRLFREATHFRDGVHMKDLSKLNRDPRRIVILDDAPENFALQPDNGIAIKPYVLSADVDPMADRSLERILPFLKALAVEGVQDFRPILSKYKGMDADAIADDYEERLMHIKARLAEEQSKGLGGALRGSNVGSSLGLYVGRRGTMGGGSAGTFIPSSKDLVGESVGIGPGRGSGGSSAISVGPKVGPPPPKEEEAGALLQMYRQHSKEAEDDYRRKMEKWNEVMQQKMSQQG